MYKFILNIIITWRVIFFCVTYKATSRLLRCYFKMQRSTKFLWHIHFIIAGVHNDKEHFFHPLSLTIILPITLFSQRFWCRIIKLHQLQEISSSTSCNCSVKHVMSFLHYDGTISFWEKRHIYKQRAQQNAFVLTTTLQFYQKVETDSLRSC